MDEILEWLKAFLIVITVFGVMLIEALMIQLILSVFGLKFGLGGSFIILLVIHFILPLFKKKEIKK